MTPKTLSVERSIPAAWRDVAHLRTRESLRRELGVKLLKDLPIGRDTSVRLRFSEELEPVPGGHSVVYRYELELCDKPTGARASWWQRIKNWWQG